VSSSGSFQRRLPSRIAWKAASLPPGKLHVHRAKAAGFI
jgi:hypothetical protein